MDVTGFFDYPEDAPPSAQAALVFLPDMDEAGWRRILSFTQRRLFRAGDVVLKAGDTGRALSIVSRGALEVVLPQKGRGELRVALLKAGTVLGELAFLDGEPRSATVRALEDGEMHVLGLEAFEVLAARHPELARAMLMDLGRIVSQRLRRAMAQVRGGLR